MGVGICSLFTKTRYSGVLAVIVLISQLSYVSCLTSSEKEGINRGLEAGISVANLLGRFSGIVSQMGSSVGPYLGVIASCVSIILAFIPTETAELVALKRMMERIDNRFDRIDSQFNDVKRMIDWSNVEVIFGQIEQNILALSFEYEQLYKVPRNATANQTIFFLNTYDSDYQSSGYKLYSGLTTRGTFRRSLGKSIIHYTKNDRNLTQTFLCGIMQLLIKAAKIEIAYFQAKHMTEVARHRKTLWVTRIKEVIHIYEGIDQTVKNKFASQYKLEIREYAARHVGLYHSDFARGLYNLLKNKYYWRHWIVFAYNPIRGWDLHTLSVRSGRGVCAGDIFLEQNGRNIWVQSCEENRTKLDVGRAEQYLRNVRQEGFTYYITPKSARNIYQSLALNEYNACAAAVIKKRYYGFFSSSSTELAFHGNTERLAFYNEGNVFNLIMWG